LKTARDFIAVGKLLSLPNEADEETKDAIYAVGLLLQTAGELAVAAGRLLSDGEHYAGAALVRQVVEIEYLTWTFKEGHRSASKWLQSTHSERMNAFSPREQWKPRRDVFSVKTTNTIVSKVSILCPEAVFFLQVQVREALNYF
jgi:hypothetical protein